MYEVKNMKKRWILAFMAVCMLAGCGKKSPIDEEIGTSYRNDVPAQTLVEAVASEFGEDYWANADLVPEYLDDWFGVSEDMYDDFYGQTPMISVNVDTLLVIKAKEDQIENVENSLDTYKEAMVQDTMQYPINIPKIQAARIETFGNYVCYVQLGADKGSGEDEEAAVKACQEMNDRALAVIEGKLTQ